MVLPVIVKFSEIRKVKQYISSSAFYTCCDGYKMNLRLYPKGVNGAGTHLSIFLCIMKGEHDEKLMWPLKQQFQVIAMNQVCNDHHRVMRITYDKDTSLSSASRVENDSEALGLAIVSCISVEDFYAHTPSCQYVKDE